MNLPELRHQLNAMHTALARAINAGAAAERTCGDEIDLSNALVQARVELEVVQRRIANLEKWLPAPAGTTA